MRQQNINKGFTLIELIVVLAILAILALIAIPALFSTNVAKAQFSEGFSLGSGFKTAVSSYYAQNGSFPDNTSQANGEISLFSDNEGQYVKSISTANGKILVQFKTTQEQEGLADAISGKKLLLEATIKGMSMIWKCSSDAKKDHIPSQCKSTTSDLSVN